ncbi:MAG: hypothetical protein JO093_13670 [Acidobacteria bacterium]|nr:hypothetical protein [Acidobacteriota bacterium]MBV9068514.1 hypothetical protein [Acidobacteriota bacterium]MBV9186662.1 hypothetical protein [Acidobacteriota bacterium]
MKRITTAEFEAFFQLDSPGYYIAKKAVEHDEVTKAVDVLEVLVLTNKFFQIELRNRITAAIAERSKMTAQEYLKALGTDRSNDIALKTLGKERLKAILQDTADYVTQESKVGMGVNEKV